MFYYSLVVLASLASVTDTQDVDQAILDWDGRELPVVSFQAIERRSDAILTEFLLDLKPLPAKLRFEWTLRRGQARYYQRKFDSAYTDFQKCIELQPDNKRALFEFARISIREKKNREKSLQIAKQLKADKATAAQGLFLVGLDYSYHDKNKEAMLELSRAIKLDPTWATPRRYRLYCNLSLHDYNSCEEDLQHIISRPQSLLTSFSQLHVAYAEILINLKRYDDASSHFCRAMQMSPDKEPTLGSYWHLSSWRGEYGKCLFISSQHFQQFPHSLLAYRHYTLSLAHFGRLNTALRRAKKAVEKSLRKAHSLNTLAIVQAERGEYASSVKNFKRALDVYGKKDFFQDQNALRCALLLAACPQEKIRDSEEAIRILDKHTTHENVAKTMLQVKMIIRAVAKAEQGETQAASTMVADAIALVPGESESNLRYKKLQKLFQQGKPYRAFSPNQESRLIIQSPAALVGIENIVYGHFDNKMIMGINNSYDID